MWVSQTQDGSVQAMNVGLVKQHVHVRLLHAEYTRSLQTDL